jgi:Chain length determinant protein
MEEEKDITRLPVTRRPREMTLAANSAADSARPSMGTLLVLWRGRWIILACALAGVISGAIYLVKATPIYTSGSVVYVQSAMPKIINDDLSRVSSSTGYPFGKEYHDATWCYLLTGWQVVDRTSYTQIDSADPRTTRPYFAANIEKLAEGKGYLLFSAFDESGHWDEPSKIPLPSDPIALSLRMSRELALRPPTCEVQTLSVTAQPLDSKEKDHLAQLFLGVRESMRSQTTVQTNK